MVLFINYSQRPLNFKSELTLIIWYCLSIKDFRGAVLKKDSWNVTASSYNDLYPALDNKKSRLLSEGQADKEKHNDKNGKTLQTRHRCHTSLLLLIMRGWKWTYLLTITQDPDNYNIKLATLFIVWRVWKDSIVIRHVSQLFLSILNFFCLSIAKFLS